MKLSTNCIVLKGTCLGIVIFMSPLDLSAAEERGHCDPNETVWFNAALEGLDKVVSVCGPSGPDRDNGKIQFRIGLPGNIDWVYPAKDKLSRKAFIYRRYTRARVSLLKLEFVHAGRNYAILDSSIDEDTLREESLQFRITRLADEKVISTHNLLKRSSSASIMGLEDRVRTLPYDE